MVEDKMDQLEMLIRVALATGKNVKLKTIQYIII